MTNKQFAVYHRKYESVIQAIARKYAGSDQDMFDDLIQVATIGLYEADLKRPFKNEDAFLRQIIRNKIVDHLRWLDHKRFERLDQRLAQGDQVVRDSETGEVTFVHFSPRKDSKIVDRRAPERQPDEEDYE